MTGLKANPTDTADPAPDLEDPTPDAPPVIAWVEGIARIPEWHSEGRVALDQMRRCAIAIGLHVFVQRADPGAEGSARPRRRRWTSRRVPFESVADTAAAYPGIRMVDVVERLYKSDPWTSAAQQHAQGKLRVAISRLGRSRVYTHIDRDGEERLYPAGHTALQPAPVPAPVTPAALSGPATAVAARRLIHYMRLFQRTSGDIDATLATDPTWFEDAARAIVTAARDVEQVPLEQP